MCAFNINFYLLTVYSVQVTSLTWTESQQMCHLVL